MKRNVRIVIHSGEGDCAARGTWEQTARGWLLAYDEPESADMGTVHTELVLTDGTVRLTRTGDVRVELCFDPGTPHSSLYETACGSFPVGTVTHTLQVRTGARGGRIKARYTLILGGAADERELNILIRTEE